MRSITHVIPAKAGIQRGRAWEVPISPLPRWERARVRVTLPFLRQQKGTRRAKRDAGGAYR